MLDTDILLITFYVIADDFCATNLLPEPVRRGPEATLSRSEVITLACFGQFAIFQSERGFWRFAQAHLRHLSRNGVSDSFPRLPDRTRFNRLEREHEEAITAFSHYVCTDLLDGQNCAYEIVDRVGVATRWCNRRGVGASKLACVGCRAYGQGIVRPSGLVPWLPSPHRCQPEWRHHRLRRRLCFGSAAAKDQPLAHEVFAARHIQDPSCPFVGAACRSACYVADAVNAGFILHRHGLGSGGAGIRRRFRPVSTPVL